MGRIILKAKLKRILHTKLIAMFFAIVGFGILLVGYTFNIIL